MINDGNPILDMTRDIFFQLMVTDMLSEKWDSIFQISISLHSFTAEL